MAWTGTSCAFAQAIACHSGLNDASGANAARAGSATTYPSSATGGTQTGIADPSQHRLDVGGEFDEHDVGVAPRRAS